MFCSISGHVPERPVISKKSGRVYEGRLIEKYIEENGRDPVTGEALGLDDLVEVKSDPKQPRPRPPVLSSIPSLLNTLQSEYDSTMLECANLRSQYQALRQELSHALYQNDAAYRVIARLVKERDTAREALAKIDASLGRPTSNGHDAAGPGSESMHVDGDDEVEGQQAQPSLPPDVSKEIEEKSAELSALRKKRKVHPNWTSPETVQNFGEQKVIPSLHSTRPAGITALSADAEARILLTGGNDKVVQLFDRVESKVLASMKGHQKKINDVLWVKAQGEEGPYIVSAGGDKTVKIWQEADGNWKVLSEVRSRAEVLSLALHPTQRHFVTASADGSWSLVDIQKGKVLSSVSHPDDSKITAIQVHPDGNILAAGSEGVIRVWDIRGSSALATFTDHRGYISDLAFSENGYYLASAASGNDEIKIWDLRKLSTVAALTGGPSSIKALAFDHSGHFLAATGEGATVIWQSKVWTELSRFVEKGTRLGLVWNEIDGSQLLTAGSDRSVKVYGRKEEDNVS